MTGMDRNQVFHPLHDAQKGDGDMIPRMKVCANCRNAYIKGDRYCRYCGAPMGKPDYIEEDFATIYGPPPVKRVHQCRKCSFQWTTFHT